jgi:hypothetical protein
MAIQVTSDLVTSEGFLLDGTFAYLNIYLLNDAWVNISYFKSEDDWRNGFQPLNVDLPSRVGLDLTAQEFWGGNLVTLIHDKCVSEIEKRTGAKTCAIVTTEE